MQSHEGPRHKRSRQPRNKCVPVSSPKNASEEIDGEEEARIMLCQLTRLLLASRAREALFPFPIPFLELARCATRTKMQFFNEREVKNVSGVLFSLPPVLVRCALPNRSPFFFMLVFSPVAFSTIPNPFYVVFFCL